MIPTSAFPATAIQRGPRSLLFRWGYVVFAVLAVASCDRWTSPLHRVQPGHTEAEVIRRVGKPDHVALATDSEGWHSGCAPTSAKALVYRRESGQATIWVYLDQEDRVVCMTLDYAPVHY